MSGILAGVLVAGMCGAELWDRGQPLSLHPQEERHVAGAGDKRRRDFMLGRACAHAALAQLGRDAEAVGRATEGAPLWPAGVAGSITHTKGYAAAIVGPAGTFAGIGLDAERIGAVTQDLWPRLFGPAERAALAAEDDAALLAALFFSAKEAAYKAWGLKGLGFRDIAIARTADGFTASHPGRLSRGRYAAGNGLVLTLVAD